MVMTKTGAFWPRFLISAIYLSLVRASKIGEKPQVAATVFTALSPEEVWFQVGVANTEHSRFTLKCEAPYEKNDYYWYKDGKPLEIDGVKIQWQRRGQSGNIVFPDPQLSDQGSYQCHVDSFYGDMYSHVIQVKHGELDHFKTPPGAVRTIKVQEGDSLTLPCHGKPHGTPEPYVVWFYRDTVLTGVMETVRRKHITVDGDGNLQFSTTTHHDGRPNLHYECAVTNPVLRGQYFAGERIRIEVLPARRTVGIRAHRLWFSPEYVEVKAGGRLKLICIFGGRPVPEVRWSKTEGDLPKKRMKDMTSAETDYGKSLIIENIHPKDAGYYECSSQDIKHRMFVNVSAAPYWEIGEPEHVTTVETNTAELHCPAAGDPQPLIQWYRNGEQLYGSEDSGAERRMLLDSGRILRIVDAIQKQDAGVYQCNASNPLGYIWANIALDIQAFAPVFHMPIRRIFKVVRGSVVDMSCDVTAAPEPVVRWVDTKDQAIQIIPGRIQLFANHTLRIYDVSSADEDEYYCNVSNKYGLNRAYNRLQIYNPTYFKLVPSPKSVVMEAGGTVEFKCQARSDPRLYIDYQWRHNGVVLNDSISLTDDGVSLLSLKNTRGRNSGKIDCAAITDVDVHVAEVDLLVMDVPEKPDVYAIECDQRRAMILWKNPSAYGDPVTHFDVQMETAFAPGEWHTIVKETETAKDTFQADITLSPWVNYTFRIIAYNSHGASEPGYNVDAMCSTKPAPPYTNPEEVYAMGNDPTNLVIYWKPMNKIDWNAPQLNYLIQYRLNKEGENWHEFLIEDPLQNHTVIRDQPTFMEYEVKVRAVNSEGRSVIDPDRIIGYSGEDEPLEAPRDLQLREYHNFSSALLNWEPVNESTLRGHFEGYKVEYWLNREPYNIIVEHVDRHATSVVLSRLSAVTNYTARVAAVNKQYAGPHSDYLQFFTPEGAPSKVHNLRVRAVGASSLLLTWAAPQQPNGNIRGYFISFENATGEVKETYVLHRQLYYLFEEAQPDSPYKVSVWAETNGGEGPRVLRLVHTWPLRDPDVPIFEAVSLSPDTIDVEWMPSNGSTWGMPGASFFVNFTREGMSQWIQTESVTLPTTEVTLRGLDEDSTYLLIGVARDGTRVRSTRVSTIRTQGVKGITHISRRMSRTPASTILVMCCCCKDRKQGEYAVKRRELERGHHYDDEHRAFIEYQYGADVKK
uniref:Neuroglian n=1 Tax=Steinernema glaseri TaxID=37863 RepID=A0A1I8AK21_9BILA